MKISSINIVHIIEFSYLFHPQIQGVFYNEARRVSVRFDSESVRKFCNANGLSLIFRAHQVPMDGLELFAGGRLVTVFSACGYEGQRNKAALLEVSKRMCVRAKLIDPTSASQSSNIQILG